MAICGHFKFICPSAVPIILAMLILLFLIAVVQLAPQHEVASRTHRSTINWIFITFSLIIDYWIDNGIRVYSVFIMIIINLITDKSRLYYKITIKYLQKVPYSSYTRIKPRSRPPQKKPHILRTPIFQLPK